MIIYKPSNGDSELCAWEVDNSPHVVGFLDLKLHFFLACMDHPLSFDPNREAQVEMAVNESKAIKYSLEQVRKFPSPQTFIRVATALNRARTGSLTGEATERDLGLLSNPDTREKCILERKRDPDLKVYRAVRITEPMTVEGVNWIPLWAFKANENMQYKISRGRFEAPAGSLILRTTNMRPDEIDTKKKIYFSTESGTSSNSFDEIIKKSVGKNTKKATKKAPKEKTSSQGNISPLFSPCEYRWYVLTPQQQRIKNMQRVQILPDAEHTKRMQMSPYEESLVKSGALSSNDELVKRGEMTLYNQFKPTIKFSEGHATSSLGKILFPDNPINEDWTDPLQIQAHREDILCMNGIR